MSSCSVIYFFFYSWDSKVMSQILLFWENRLSQKRRSVTRDSLIETLTYLITIHLSRSVLINELRSVLEKTILTKVCRFWFMQPVLWFTRLLNLINWLLLRVIHQLEFWLVIILKLPDIDFCSRIFFNCPRVVFLSSFRFEVFE